MRMSVWSGTNFVTELPIQVEDVAPGVGANYMSRM